ncbi:hypothetical protein GCM10017744_069860 [Streptomyces antimycoticus]|uniref:Uncharacterized protein n=1 Tax=Streptomyces antimycoticus TaxID=68175 RepID=A0A4D4K065_9ACTN|nr:hypothetical protein SSPO_069550 [Streptomyces antimycoticus]GDY42315.1 hypothetical protein SANT12839_031970 [Streptomyces antimycoticus]
MGGRERRGDVVPDHMGLRIAVQEQNGRPVPGRAYVDSHTLDVKGAAVEVAQQLIAHDPIPAAAAVRVQDPLTTILIGATYGRVRVASL